jgi:hypothetical protein
MSNTSRLIDDLHEIAALDEALRHQLQNIGDTLNALFNAREKAVRMANSGKWDHSQYILDDTFQRLNDLTENLADFSPLPSPFNKFLAA